MQRYKNKLRNQIKCDLFYQEVVKNNKNDSFIHENLQKSAKGSLAPTIGKHHEQNGQIECDGKQKN
jgi:hypothetical protein